MKYIKTLLIFFIFIQFNSLAQPSKSDLVFSGTLAHYFPFGKESLTPGNFVYPIDPGLELLYQYRLGSALLISSGLSYQTGRVSTLKGGERRLRFGEISVPIQIKSILIKIDKVNLVTTVGYSYGQMIHLDFEEPYVNKWVNVHTEYEEHYSEKDSFTDLLFGLGLSFPVTEKNALEISPYIKYRLKDYWMEYYRDNVYCGIKICYQLNLGKNDK